MSATDDDLPRALTALDQTAEGAKYRAIGDVSGGLGRANTVAENGEDGTFYLVSHEGLLIILK